VSCHFMSVVTIRAVMRARLCTKTSHGQSKEEVNTREQGHIRRRRLVGLCLVCLSV